MRLKWRTVYKFMDQDQQHQSITNILVSRGFLTQNQVTKVLEYQCRLPPGQYMSFTQIVVEFEYMTEAGLKAALGDLYDKAQDPVGQILVQQGLVSMDQLKQALEVLNTFPRSHVVDILIDMGFATLADVGQAISRYQVQQTQRLRALAPVDISEASAEESASAGEPALTDEPPSPEQVAVEQAAVHLPLGRQLIAQGYLTEDELRDAIEYQQRLPKVMYKPLGEILVSLGYINEQQLQPILAMQAANQQARPRIGEILIQSGLIAEWQLSHALSLQFSPEHGRKKLGSLLVELGYASRDEIEGALTRYAQKSPQPTGFPTLSTEPEPVPAPKPAPVQSAEPQHVPLGQILTRLGYITEAQLDQALTQQSQLSAEYKPLGDILVLMGYLTEEQLQDALAQQPGFGREPMGQILIRQGVIEEWQLSHALCAQFEAPESERRNLGAVLVTLGYATQEQIEAAILGHFRQRRQED